MTVYLVARRGASMRPTTARSLINEGALFNPDA